MIADSHAVVWVDHRNAHIFSYTRESADTGLVRHKDAPHHIHHKAGSIGAGHSEEDTAYLRSVAEALSPAREVLIVGPAETKTAFKRYLDKFAPQLSERVVGVEPCDHPTDAQILAYAKKFFHDTDRTLPEKFGKRR